MIQPTIPPEYRNAKRALAAVFALGAVIFFSLALVGKPGILSAFGEKEMPEFHNQDPKRWINSAPLTRESLKGKVVLIEIWTSI